MFWAGPQAGRPGWQRRPFAAGTLEQVYLSPLPSWLLAAAARVVAALAETLIVVAGIYGIVSIVVPLHYHWSAAVLLPRRAAHRHQRRLLADHRRDGPGGSGSSCSGKASCCLS